MISDYEDFEETDEQVTMLIRISSGIVNENKSFYDPLKDFMSMNRMMRRQMNDRGEKLKALYVDKEYRRVDVLAIYK